MNNSVSHCMYYVAIVCPDNLNNKIKGFKLWMQEKFGCKVALKSPAHITLIPPFWFKGDDENMLLEAISTFRSSIGEIDIHLQDFAHFSNRVLYISIKQNDLLNRIRKETEQHFIHTLGDIIKKETRPFTPHITIANRDLKPGDFLKAWEHFSHKKFEKTFIPSQLSLLKLSPDKWNVISEKNWTKA